MQRVLVSQHCASRSVHYVVCKGMSWLPQFCLNRSIYIYIERERERANASTLLNQPHLRVHAVLLHLELRGDAIHLALQLALRTVRHMQQQPRLLLTRQHAASSSAV